MLVERFVRAVVEDGVPVEAILAITFTDKAAAEMRTRVRARFVELDRRAEARAVEGAWISTIHGFCARVLRAHALSAGIDPDFRVLGELEAERIAADAFDGALEAFMGTDPDRLEMVAAYTPDGLGDMVRTAYSRLRSKGQRHPRLDELPAPRAGDQAERLTAAVAGALRELGAAGDGVTVARALAKVERCAALLERAAGGRLAEPGELKDLSFGRNAKALCTEPCVEYCEALAAYAALSSEHKEYRDHGMLRELLELYGDRYEAGKRARSAVDFEDLELLTRELLADHEGLRLQYAERFAHVLVDELQDTNPLQNALIEQLERDNVFRVGDENQSIYGFRNADVEVFREHWAAAAAEGRTESITVNFRSRGEVLDAIDRCFAGSGPRASSRSERAPRQGRRARALRGAARDRSRQAPLGRGARRGGPVRRRHARRHAVARGRGAAARQAGARAARAGGLGVARHRAAVPRHHPHELLRARARRARHPHARGRRPRLLGAAAGRGPAPLAGGAGEPARRAGRVQRAGLAAGRALARRRGADRDGGAADRARPVVAAARRRRAGRAALARGRAPRGRVRRAVRGRAPDGAAGVARDADRPGRHPHRLRPAHAVAGGRHAPDGQRAQADADGARVRGRRGRDLRGFIDTLAERDEVQSREGEAPLEAEALDAVRLMTVHRAKGLEFPVVCVADLGKDGREDYGRLRISDDGMTGLRLASLGGASLDSARLAEIKEREKAAGEQEERRIFYVAATRAQEHLLLSGATDLEKRHPPEDMKEPMRWLLRGFPGSRCA